MGQRGPKPKPFNATWTPALAWVVGIITTDGSLAKDGRHIDITSNDRQLLTAVQQCLGTDVYMGRKRGSFSGSMRSFRIQIGSVAFYRWLLTIGLTPQKSKTIGPLAIPDVYFWDFLRGCFDGDGSCYAYWDIRWRSSYMYYWELSSASPAFIAWIRGRIQKLVDLRGHISASHGCDILKYAKRESMILFKKMYYDPNAPCLHRKRDKVDHILLSADVMKPVNMPA